MLVAYLVCVVKDNFRAFTSVPVYLAQISCWRMFLVGVITRRELSMSQSFRSNVAFAFNYRYFSYPSLPWRKNLQAARWRAMLVVDSVCVVRDNFRASTSIPVIQANQDKFQWKLKNFGLCTTRGFRGAQGICFMYVAQSTGLSFIGWLRPCRRPLL